MSFSSGPVSVKSEQERTPPLMEKVLNSVPCPGSAPLPSPGRESSRSEDVRLPRPASVESEREDVQFSSRLALTLPLRTEFDALVRDFFFGKKLSDLISKEGRA